MSKPEKIFLFNEKDFSNWTTRDGSESGWTIDKGFMTVKPGTGDIMTKEVFGDAFIHLEFRCPDMPDKHGQDKGNSGVFIHGRYEVQVLDSYGVDSGRGDCSAIYDKYAPLFNNCRPAMEWQSYDIIFRAPRFAEDGSVSEKPRLTLLFNGLPVHNNLTLESVTGAPLTEEMVAEGPLLLQDHGNTVSYRNVWMCRLPQTCADHY